MANVNITPQTVLLTSGQAVPFEATGAGGQPVSVNWSLNPPTPASGSLVTPVAGAQALSATYVAPPLVAAAQTVAVIASTTTDSATATISLTPDAVAIVPAKVDLKAGEEQKFVAIVAGAPTPGADWILSPLLGTLDGQTGLYKAPPEILDSTTVAVVATHRALGRQAVATINLTSPPWQGLGVSILGIYLLLVFSLVFLMVGLWPPELPSADAAKTNRIEAEKTLGEKADDLKSAELAAAKALEEKKTAAMETSNKNVQSAGTPENKTQGNAANLGAANANATAADAALQRAKEAWDFASKDLNKKRTIEEAVDDPNVDTKLAGHINRELDLLWLVLLAGSLGSFLHIAQSYSDFIGNRTLKSSWAWWYSFRPFIGAGLALVFYAAVRGGVMAVATGSNATAKASELNPFGLVSVAAMVGMFSKAATTKLGEVFDTLFKSGKAKDKDPLVPSSQTSNQPAGKATAGGGAASTAAK